MKPLRFLPYVHHQTRALIVMVGLLVLYCAWLWLLDSLGMIGRDSSSSWIATLLLLPLIPVAIFDLWLRLSWQQETPTLYPPPPTRLQRLLQAEYGLFWFPVFIMIPLWLWSIGLLGAIVGYWLFG